MQFPAVPKNEARIRLFVTSETLENRWIMLPGSSSKRPTSSVSGDKPAMSQAFVIDPLFDPERTLPIAGRKCVSRWNLSTIFHNLFEIPTAAIAPLLPKGVEPLEVRPGVSLYDIGDVLWNSGNLDGSWPAFHELTAMIVVQPDLSIDMPMPKFAFYVPKIIANWSGLVKMNAGSSTYLRNILRSKSARAKV